MSAKIASVTNAVSQTGRGIPQQQKTESEFAAVFEHTPIPMILVDGAGIVRRVNRAASMLGQGSPMANKRGGEALHCVHHFASAGGCGTGHACSTCPLRQTVIETATTGQSKNRVVATMTLLMGKTPVHREFLVTTTPLPVDGNRMVLACLEDVTERNLATQRLEHLSHHDSLTGLANRLLLNERLQDAISRSRQNASSRYAVLFLDLDRFKNVNDSLGHEAGDLLLREITERLKEAVGGAHTGFEPMEGMMISRLGGDEFVVLLEGTQAPAVASHVADRLLKALASPFRVAGQDIITTASIGIVTSDCGHEDAGTVLRDADTAMYEAKAAGKSRAVAFDATMRARARRRMALESGIMPSLQRGEFIIHYQPIVSLETRALEGFEALMRWKHPELGMISPGEFIPIAEETGAILVLGEWSFREACRQLACWWRRYGRDVAKSMNINLSRRQLGVPGVAQRFREIAREEKVEPEAIHLEVTENAIMADEKAAALMLRELKSLGFKVDLDDFGTGYSSLAALHQFPIDFLKLDRSFTANIGRGRGYAALVNAIINLGENLGIQAIIEGVETLDQVSMLQSLNCVLAQGYYFGRPMPAEEAAEYFRRTR